MNDIFDKEWLRTLQEKRRIDERKKRIKEVFFLLIFFVLLYVYIVLFGSMEGGL